MSPRYILSFFLCFALSITIKAEIKVVQVYAANKGACDGIIVLRANGSAGPFTVEIQGIGNSSITYDVQGDLEIKALCPGNYTISVFPENYPTCTTSISATILVNDGTSIKDPEDDGTKSLDNNIGDDILIKAYPNPFSGTLHLDVIIKEEQTVLLSLIDATGRRLYSTQKRLFKGNNQLLLNLRDQGLSEGIYDLIIQDENNNQKAIKVSYLR